jgi:phosphoglycerate dehydrogenase-like enzyme
MGDGLMADQRLHVTVPDARWLERLGPIDGVDFTVWDLQSEQPERYVDLAVRPYVLSTQGLDRLEASRLGVIQAQSLGFDGVADVLPAGIGFCNAVGVHEASTAELAIALLLASQREVDRYAREVGQWNKAFTSSLIDKRIMLLGYGGIGQELHKRLVGFDADIVRVATTARTDDHGQIHAIDDVHALLADVDVVLLAVPLTDATTHLVDDAFLAAMPDGSIVVNVSRGAVVHTDAVVRQGGRVRLAADVTDPEPLPSDHPLWTTPGVLISPHVGGMSSAMAPRIEAVVRRQIARLLQGEDPTDMVIGAR